MKKIVVLLLLFTFSFSGYSQVEIQGTNLSLEMIKERKIGMLSVQFAGTYNILSGKDNKRVQVRLKIRSLDGEKTVFDPNKLSLASDKLKTRFSVSEALFASFLRSKGFQLLTTNDTEKPIFAKYDPSVPNTFDDYSIDGYKDCAINLNFGTKRAFRSVLKGNPNPICTIGAGTALIGKSLVIPPGILKLPTR